jgi:Asp-tRNA(Asn)/Glu-tRNA(Gln) amidotransferase A subunit family amidase
MRRWRIGARRPSLAQRRVAAAHAARPADCACGPAAGVQIVGRHRDDIGVLQLAYAFQQATRFWKPAPRLAV